MKHRYNVQTFVDAESIEDAIKLAKRTKPHQVYLDENVFKERGYAIKDENKKRMGYEESKGHH
jgi:hypothetical protein